MLEAMIYILRTGVPWRDLPERFGKWTSVYSRWRRWILCGLWERIFLGLTLGARGTTRFVDSTYIKLHQDGANPAGGQRAQGIGLTKGGLNTKLTALADSYGRAVALSLLPGQCSEIEAVEPHLCRLRGRTLVGDKGFDADSVRERVQRVGGDTCIPRRKNCTGRRPFRRRLYHRRHRIENFFCRIKRYRRLSTRYEKLAVTFLAFVQLAAILDWLKF